MNSDASLPQKDFFNKHFQEALIIRAICDDFNFPAEYSPVFVNIHIRGPGHFQSPPLPKEYYDIVFQFLDYSSTDRISDTLSKMDDDDPMKEHLNKIKIKDQIAELDKILAKKENKSNYLSNQMKMIKRLYYDNTFLNDMIALYNYFVKPYINEYDDEKVKRGFSKRITQGN